MVCSFFAFVVIVLSDEPRQNQGRAKGRVGRPQTIAGRPKAALLFWFFGGFKCGVPLFFVILVIY